MVANAKGAVHIESVVGVARIRPKAKAVNVGFTDAFVEIKTGMAIGTAETYNPVSPKPVYAEFWSEKTPKGLMKVLTIWSVSYFRLRFAVSSMA
jgi:hypothetical protein